MNELRDAIYTTATGNATLNAAIGGRMFHFEGPYDPDSMDFPYIAYTFVSGVPSWGFGTSGPTNRTEEVRVQFDIWSDTATSKEACDIYGYLRGVFDWATLTVTSYTCIRCMREGFELRKQGQYWNYMVEYLIRMEAS